MPFGDRTGPRGEGPYTGLQRQGAFWKMSDAAAPRGPLGIWPFPILSAITGAQPPDTGDEVGGMIPKPGVPPRYLPDSPVPFVTHGTYDGERTQMGYWVIGFPEWSSYSIYWAETVGTRKRDYNAISRWYNSIEAAVAEIARVF